MFLVFSFLFVMYNFYQSSLRQYINREIYRKPTGMITIGDQDYQYVVKQKSILGVNVNRYQILGIELPIDWLGSPEQFREHVMGVCREQRHSQGDCFVQLWLTNQLGICSVNDTKSDSYRTHWDTVRRQQESGILRLWWYSGLVENMPAATVVIDISQSLDELLDDMSGRTRTQIRKAQHNWLVVEVATLNDRDEYYTMREETSDIKWFAIQSRYCYDALRDYLLYTQQWHLYVVRDDQWCMLAGAICVSVDGVYVYLYGATRRWCGNLWHAHLLHWEVIQWAKQQWYLSYDLLGVSPGSLQSHHLDGVTQFKMSFGGKKIEYMGNYDFPLSNWKYEMFRWYRKTKA